MFKCGAFIAFYFSHQIKFGFAVPPSIRGGEQEVIVVENSQAQLVCLAEGVPQPSLSWEKGGKLLNETTAEYTILPSGELVIDSAQVRKQRQIYGNQQHVFVFMSFERFNFKLVSNRFG